MPAEKPTTKTKTMKPSFRGRTAIAAGLGLFAFMVALLLVLNAKFQLLTPSPRIYHEAIAPPQTRLEVSVRPSLELGYLKSRFGDRLPIVRRIGAPNWLIKRIMPHEAAVMFEPNLADATATAVLFVNDRRLGPVITRASRQANISAALPYIEWDSDALIPNGPGCLTMQGTMPLSSSAVSVVKSRWGKELLSLPPLEPPEDDHFIEALLDNRDGGGLVAVMSLLDVYEVPLDRLLQSDLAQVWEAIRDVRFYGDIDEAEAMPIHFEVAFQETAPAQLLQGFTVTFGSFIEQLRGRLDDPFEGSGAMDGFTYKADYTLADPDVLWEWLL